MPRKTNKKPSPKRRVRSSKNTSRSSKKQSHIQLNTNKLLIIIGTLLISISAIYHINKYIQLTYFTPVVPKIVSTYSPPVQIKIQKVRMDLPIGQTAIQNGLWGVFDGGASHLSTSARPGQKGPIVLYAHNTNNRFGPIRWLNIGDEISIQAKNGKIHKYKVTKSQEVGASDVELLANIKKETLVLYTCTGFADLRRYFVFATPIR